MSSNETLPPVVVLDVSSISLALFVLGFYVCAFGQISYTLKERLYMSSALISICVGIGVGPIGLNWIAINNWTGNNVTLGNEITYQFTRLIIGIQVMFAGISLPAAYLQREWKSIAMLLLPIMTLAWFVSAGFILLLIPGLTFLEALCIAACVTPTDPILANAIVKGRYAEKHVPTSVRNIISAESGANDGLGYPFIFLPILLMRRGPQSINDALKEWILQTWLYEIVLACVLGAVIGFVARKSLKFAHKRQLIDHESFLSYGVGLAFLVLGVVGILGSDDLLAAFIAGNSLTWRDFYRIESEEDAFQDVLDSLLNAAIFIYIGALLPWSDFGNAAIQLSPWRLVVLAICILLFRRLPWILMLYPWIPALEDRQQAIFSGWFGPVGVSAVYYAMVALRELPDNRTHLREVIVPVVLFIAFSSTVAHGITIPLTKFGPRVLTRTRSQMTIASTNANSFFRRFGTSGNSPGSLSSVTPSNPSILLEGPIGTSATQIQKPTTKLREFLRARTSSGRVPISISAPVNGSRIPGIDDEPNGGPSGANTPRSLPHHEGGLEDDGLRRTMELDPDPSGERDGRDITSEPTSRSGSMFGGILRRDERAGTPVEKAEEGEVGVDKGQLREAVEGMEGEGEESIGASRLHVEFTLPT